VNNGRGRALYTTRFPYWMIEESPRPSDISVQKFKDLQAILEQRALEYTEEVARLSQEDLRPAILGEQDLPDTDDDEDFDEEGALFERAADMLETDGKARESENVGVWALPLFWRRHAAKTAAT
jgi:hypothetical protein